MKHKRYPFKFLDAYTLADSDLFFGRADEVEQLYEMVFQTDLLLVYGASGTGKTSLIQCGLASKFQSHDWLPLSIRRGGDLNASFEKALQEAGGGDGQSPSEADADLNWLDEDPALNLTGPATARRLSPLARRFRAIYLRHFKPLYLIFDQFEELYILGNKPEQEQFIQTVKEILLVEQPVKIIISIREEYLGHLYEFERQVPELLRKKLRVEPMNLDKVKSVIKGVGAQPRSNVGLKPGEEDLIAEGVFAKIRGEEKTLTIQLPYLQVFLDKLYLQTTQDETRIAEAVFSMSDLEQMGDIGDVLRDFLDEQVLNIARELKQPAETIWHILSPFVTLEGTKEPLSAAALYHNLPGVSRSLIDRALEELANRRILRYTEQEQLYEIAHDSLARQVHDKRSDEEIAVLEVRRLIRSQTVLKDEAREPFSEKQLQFIEPYLSKFKTTDAEQEWIERSREEVRRQKLAEEKRQKEELEKAQRQAAIERDLADKANAALAEVRKKNVSIFESFAGLGAELIRTLDHAEALEKMKVAVEIDIDFNVKKLQLTEPIEELLFFFAEGGRRPVLARTAAELLIKLEPEGDLAVELQKCLKEKWDQRSRFAPLLKNLRFFQKFQARYYPEMVSVPLGESGVFEMGSPESEQGRYSDEFLHKVKLSPYQIAATPITFYQFALFSEAVDKGIASRTPSWGRFGDHPAVNVSWYDAVKFADWLNAQNGRPPCYKILEETNSDKNNQVQYDFLKWKVDWKKTAKGFRLPTEAEWELAARGGVGAPRTLYAGSDNLDEVGWYWENSGDKPLSGDWDLNKIYDNNGRTHAVKEKSDNGIGLYDMSGNVYEWCWDWYDENYYNECREKGEVFNPLGAKGSSEGRVIRGGSWDYDARDCRTAYRYRGYPDIRYLNIGFRLVFVP